MWQTEKCLLLWHHFLSKIVIKQTFYHLIHVYSNNATNLYHFTQYAMLPHNIEIVMWPKMTVTYVFTLCIRLLKTWQNGNPANNWDFGMLSGYMGFILNYDQIGLHVSCSNRFTFVKMASDETTKTLTARSMVLHSVHRRGTIINSMA